MGRVPDLGPLLGGGRRHGCEAEAPTEEIDERGEAGEALRTPDRQRCLDVLSGPPDVADIADEIAGP